MKWWQRSAVYHVYVRSFRDSNGDGIGDLPGLASELDYLSDLDVDALWLSPIHPSPNDDFGYDVADYEAVHPEYGSLDDLLGLAEALHERGKRLLLDLVPSHTSSEHAWFQESRSARTARTRDWYVWRDPAPGGGPPNNWQSVFGGSAWELDDATGQYYLHSYLVTQPDLNWRNPEVVDAMHGVMRYWLDRGIDGFRVDAVQQLMKDPELRSNPPNAAYRLMPGEPGYDARRAQELRHCHFHEDIWDLVRGMRRLVDAYEHDPVLIAEVAIFEPERFARLFGDGSDSFHLGIYFPLTHAKGLAEMRAATESLYRALPSGAWPSLVHGNHDVPRVVSRMRGDTDGDDALAKAAAAALLLPRGTPIVYYGEELGMPSVRIPDARLVDPVAARNRRRGDPESPGGHGRDPSRTPMHWTGAANAGFTTGDPWLPIGDATRNVEAQRGDDGSVWSWYALLLALRHERTALRSGRYVALESSPDVWLFDRIAARDELRVAINLTRDPTIAPLGAGHVVAGTHRAPGDPVEAATSLAPLEVVIVAS